MWKFLYSCNFARDILLILIDFGVIAESFLGKEYAWFVLSFNIDRKRPLPYLVIDK